MWAELCALGIGRMPFAEANGGLGFGGVELMLVGEAFGRVLVVEPFLSSVVLAGTALAHAETETEGWLERIMDGEAIGALAIASDVAASRVGDGWRLDGAAKQVLGANVADVILVAAGDALFVVPAESKGVTRRSYRLHGGGMAADIAFDAVLANARLAAEGAVERATQIAIGFIAAEAVGAMAGALDVTVEHLKTRVQFGAPLAANQALQHRAAEMLVELEQARSAAIYAAALWDQPNEIERARGFATVKAVIGKAGRFVAQNAVQLMGGLGVSEEHIVSHYFRRLTAIGLLFGSADEHLAELAALGGFTGPEDHLASDA